MSEALTSFTNKLIELTGASSNLLHTIYGVVAGAIVVIAIVAISKTAKNRKRRFYH